jgi:hypothetical protein
MAKVYIRKTLEEVLENIEREMIPDHINDWHFCQTAAPFIALKKLYPEDKRGTFNIQAALTSPKSIKYRQRDVKFDGGEAGDYILVDRNGGRMAVDFAIFKRLF